MLTGTVKVFLAVLAGLTALYIVWRGTHIEDGSGVVVATLAGGAGWLIRDLNQEAQLRRTICQSYAAAIETLFIGFAESVGNKQLDNYLKLAPLVKAGKEKPTLDTPYEDPLRNLPSIRQHLHLFSPVTVRLIFKWEDRCQSLQRFYTSLGTKTFYEISQERLESYIAWGREYRDQFRDVSFTALRALAAEDTYISVNEEMFKELGAKPWDDSRAIAVVLGELQPGVVESD